MATTIKLKNSVTTTATPTTLVQGEVATNITDKKLWVGNAASSPVQLIGTGASVNFTTVTTTNDASISGLTVGKGGGAVASNTAIGSGAMAATATGAANAAFGGSALAANTSGYYNSAFGYLSSAGTTTGNGNSSFGRASLYTNTTGASNTAIGQDSLFSNTTASNNTAVGYQTLYNNTASNNTAVGYIAMQSNTTGALNVAVGQSAMGANTTGDSNVAIGFQPLNSNTTGSNNVAIGRNALAFNTTASNNTAVGYQAGYSNTTGTGGNVLVGYQAGYTNSTGAYNTIVGITAGANLTSSNNTMIGAGAGLYVTSGAKNTILGTYNGNQGGLDIRTASNYIVLSDGDGNPRGIFDFAGNFLVGCTSQPSASIQGFQISKVSGSSISSAGSGTTGFNHLLFYNGNGLIGYIQSSGSTTTYSTSSDYRLKENVAPMTGALATVAKLKPVTYTWKSNGSDGQGFIAHELQDVVPDCVIGEKDAVNEDGSIKPQGIDTSFLVATLTAAIQELKAIIDLQSTEIASLKLKVEGK